MLVNEVLNYNKIIKNIIDNSTDVGGLAKFKLLGILKQFEPIVQDFEIVRNETISKYGTYNNQGILGVFPPDKDKYDNEEEFKKANDEYKSIVDKIDSELEKVAKAEVTVNISKIKYSDIMDAGIPAEYLVAIYDFIEE